MGEIGYDEDKFLHHLTWWQLRAIIRGYRKRERSMWLAIRWQTWATSCMMGGKSDSPEEFMPLPWDNVKSRAEIEDETKYLEQLIAEAREHNSHL